MKYSLVGKTCKFHEMLMSYCLTSTWPSGVFFMNREKLFSSLPTTFSVFYSIWAPSPAPSCPLYFSEHLSPFRLAVQTSMASHVSSHLISLFGELFPPCCLPSCNYPSPLLSDFLGPWAHSFFSALSLQHDPGWNRKRWQSLLKPRDLKAGKKGASG